MPCEVRVIDSKTGTVEYIASDESLDSYREVIRANGWQFDLFAKNSPFLNAHQYHDISKVLGKVIEFYVSKKRLINVVRWAIDVPENADAIKGFAMTQAGYLPAVSVGFRPTKMVTMWDIDKEGYEKELEKLDIKPGTDDAPRVIYQKQQQIELSAVPIGANPNAVAKAYKAGILDDADLDRFSAEQERLTSSAAAIQDEHAARARAHRRRSFLADIHRITKHK